eukprot:764877-Hanusia_phi.AAC.2
MRCNFTSSLPSEAQRKPPTPPLVLIQRSAVRQLSSKIAFTFKRFDADQDGFLTRSGSRAARLLSDLTRRQARSGEGVCVHGEASQRGGDRGAAGHVRRRQGRLDRLGAGHAS